MSSEFTRRRFLGTVPAAGAAMNAATTGQRPALLGGSKVRTEPFPSWPKFDDVEERALLGVLRSGKWYRGSGTAAKKFEEAYAQLTGAKTVLATANGTSALFTALNVLGVEPGDEVVL